MQVVLGYTVYGEKSDTLHVHVGQFSESKKRELGTHVHVHVHVCEVCQDHSSEEDLSKEDLSGGVLEWVMLSGQHIDLTQSLINKMPLSAVESFTMNSFQSQQHSHTKTSCAALCRILPRFALVIAL